MKRILVLAAVVAAAACFAIPSAMAAGGVGICVSNGCGASATPSTSSGSVNICVEVDPCRGWTTWNGYWLYGPYTWYTTGFQVRTYYAYDAYFRYRGLVDFYFGGSSYSLYWGYGWR